MQPGRVPGDVLIHLRRARDHIDRHYHEPGDLDTLAEFTGETPSEFQRARPTRSWSPRA